MHFLSSYFKFDFLLSWLNLRWILHIFKLCTNVYIWVHFAKKSRVLNHVFTFYCTENNYRSWVIWSSIFKWNFFDRLLSVFDRINKTFVPLARDVCILEIFALLSLNCRRTTLVEIVINQNSDSLCTFNVLCFFFFFSPFMTQSTFQYLSIIFFPSTLNRNQQKCFCFYLIAQLLFNKNFIDSSA